MIKGIVAAAALTASLVIGPAALAAPVDPIGTAPGYGLEHAGHDHDAKPKPKPDKPEPKPDKKSDKKSDKKHGHGDSSHAGGGYDSHRSHPRNW